MAEGYRIWLDRISTSYGTQPKPFTDINSTNIIERFQGTLKDRTKVVRGFKNMNTARLLTEAWLVHYNFFKEHETLGNIPPAVKMGATPIKDWAEVISQTKVAISPKQKPMLLPKKVTTAKRKHPKRKPKGLKQRRFVEASIISPRINY